MNDADRIALRDRIARAMAWQELIDHQRAEYLRKSQAVIDELYAEREQVNRLGWILLDPAEVDEAGAEA